MDMGRLCEESYAEFLDSLKAAGVEIANECELRERLAETARWRFAFMTMAQNGKAIGIRFIDHGARQNKARIRRAFARYAFPDNSDSVFAANLAAD